MDFILDTDRAQIYTVLVEEGSEPNNTPGTKAWIFFQDSFPMLPYKIEKI
jgi:hypothetical protein